MAVIVEDGTGDNFKLKIGSNNRAAIDAITETVQESAILKGDGYEIRTDPINLTASSESAILYIQNEEAEPLILDSLFINTYNSVGTLTDEPILRIYRKPNSGSIIDNAAPVGVITNLDFLSGKLLNANLYQGAQGYTLSTDSSVTIIPLNNIGVPKTTIILPEGATYGVSYQPATGSTSIDVIVGVRLIKLPKVFP